MASVLKNGSVFLHIPKTGGKWVSQVLHDLGLVAWETPHKHADLDHFADLPTRSTSMLGRLVRTVRYRVPVNPLVFCFVRNPISWYESWFSYMSQPALAWRDYGADGDPHHWHPNSPLNGLGDADFNTFVRRVLQRRPGYVTELYGLYTRAPRLFVGRQESLADDLIRLLRQMDVKFDEQAIRSRGRVGASRQSDEHPRWDPGLLREVALAEHGGLVRYGYESTLVDLGLPVR